MINAVDQFKARVLKLEIGEEYVYFTGSLVTSRSHMPRVNEIAELAAGLGFIGAAVLTQKRLGEHNYQYRLRVLRAVRNVDLDKGRVAYANSLKEE